MEKLGNHSEIYRSCGLMVVRCFVESCKGLDLNRQLVLPFTCKRMLKNTRLSRTNGMPERFPTNRTMKTLWTDRIAYIPERDAFRP